MVHPAPSSSAAEQRRRPRQQRSRATVAFVLEAAAQLFAAEGYEAVTTNAVAARAGVSIGTVYQYFPNKDGLVLALLGEHLDDAAALITERLGAVPWVQAADAVEALVRLAVEHNARNPQLTALLYQHAERSPELHAHLEALRRRIADALAVPFDDSSTGSDVDERHRLITLRADLITRAVEHLAHEVVLHPPLHASIEELIGEISRLAGYLTATPTGPYAADAGP